MRNRLTLVTVFGLVLALAFEGLAGASPAARSAASGPGVTATTINIGGLAGVTGGQSLQGQAFQGLNAYVKWFNAKGGIYGRKLKVVAQRDDASRASQDISQARALVEQDKVFAILPVATQSFLGATYLATTTTPVFGWNINQEWMKGKNLFGQSGSRSVFGEAGTYLPYIAKSVGATKVGIMDYDGAAQSVSCGDGQSASYKKYGLDQVYRSTGLNFGFTDISGEIAKMRSAGVQFLSTCMDLDGNVAAAKAVKQAGLNITVYSPQGYDSTTPKKYGSSVEGFLFQTIFRPFEAVGNNKAEKLYLAQMKANKYPTSELSLVGWLNGMLFTQALKDAGPNFTQQKVIDAVNKMSNWTAQGILAPVDYTQWPRTNLRPGGKSCVSTVQVKNGKFVPVFGKPGKPFACFPNAPQPATLDNPTYL
ncbi:MAG: ABC-type branched-chain amino acid transport system periplasmic component-like protein [Actinomycetia bacterium]|nr:ABC-type branched-chain amino acid transport system periplasmic component-like protein [Actinomycetes bacterium]